jgi:two-component system response regulator MprA
VRLLIVDDDRALRDALRRALMLSGYEVDAAPGGERALALAAEAMPDAIVLDARACRCLC